jgi:hypothetical protein
MRHIFFAIALAAFLTSGSTSIAQTGGAPEVKYKKKTVYDFEDDVVEGELQRPDGMMIGVTRTAKHSSLIKVRENFIPEMLKSAEDI